ncbi:MAG: 2-oxo acid dehydrogenase subunit E2 [Candidatus Marsarchaeota archaeon]|jgi:pyruvate dehydrogenase E2 component (dihydrolipoamide acetyltransferase)|nr:2-oxo acid dehydrogenase subunit E2 [Candidatus Marsarchaeota archaeon]
MKELKFVDVGEGITEGHIQKWLVKDGEMVKEDQPIVKVETDKAVVDVPAPGSGMVKVVAKEGTDVNVGDTIAIIGTAEELKGVAAKPGQAQQQSQKPQAATTATQAKPAAKEAEAAPSVRRLAEQLGIDINVVPGTGPHGRILENDVRAFASKSSAAPQQAAATPKFSEVLEEQHGETVERVPLTQTRKAIAKNMEASWTIPRASHMDIADANALFDVMQKEKGKMLEQFGVKLSYLPFIIKATVEALKENPHFNASYDRDKLEIIVKKYYNIGLAAEGPDGLKVVVVKDADKKSILELANEIAELHRKVTDQSITLDEMRDSSFTITNVGSLGGGFLAVPMINYPDVAILGVTVVRDWPVVENGIVKAGRILPFTLTFDHRVVDGAEAVRMGNAFKKYIEDPDFLEML